MNVKVNWFWGLMGVLGILGYVFHDSVWYAFFAFFLFFLEPVARKKRVARRMRIRAVTNDESNR